jgi:hypothetical protein
MKTIMTTIFIYECILTKFDCSLTLVTNEEVQIINDVIKHLTKHFLLKHTIPLPIIHKGILNKHDQQIKWSRHYWLKHVKNNQNNSDEHLFTVLFSYCTPFKVVTNYTPYQWVYGLHPLMPWSIPKMTSIKKTTI